MSDPRRGSSTFSWAGVSWTLTGDCCPREVLFPNAKFGLHEWHAKGRAQCVQQGSGRTVWQVQLASHNLIVKHIHPRSLADSWYQSWLGGRSRREFLAAKRLASRNIPTAQVWALGERKLRGRLLESFLVMAAVPHSQTLFSFIERTMNGEVELPHAARRQLIDETARLLAQLHEAGVEHRDLHARNILLQATAAGPRLFVVDLDELRLHRGPLPWKVASRELACTGRYFTLRTQRTDRLRFLQAYLRYRVMNLRDLPKLARELEQQTLQSRASFWRHRDSKRSQSALPIRTVSGHQVSTLQHQQLPRPVADILLADPECPFHTHLLQWYKKDRNTRVAEVSLLPRPVGTPTQVYKEFRFKGWHEALGALVRPNQATRAWRGAASLLVRELPTPLPWALVHETLAGVTTRSFLLTDRVADGMPLSHYAAHVADTVDPTEQRLVINRMIQRLAGLLRTMHGRGVSHQDLKAANILVTPPTKAGDCEQLWLIDLDGVQTWEQVPQAHIVQNLARLNVSFYANPLISRSDRLRFLRAYLGLGFHRSAEWKTLWRAVQRHTEWKVARNRRRGRVVA